jgi:hypothetical protein
MEDGEFAELVENLKRNGLLASIVVYEDKILDGRNRDRGCIEAEVTPHYLEYIGSDPLGFIVSTNLHRRHLTTGQRAVIASKLATMKWGGDRTSGEQRSNSTFASSTGEEARNAPTQAPTGITLEKAADRMQVGRTSAVLAKKISEAAAEVAAQVEAGKLSLNEAATKAGIKSKPKPSKPAHSKTLSAPDPASPDTKDTEMLIARCEEFLEAMHADFPGFTLQQIALACSTAATRMMARESGVAAKSRG